MVDTEPTSVARGFLFADVRGYSAFVERHGDRAGADLLRTYRDLVRVAVGQFRGAEIRTEGDSFYVAFDSPSAAVRCGLAILGATELARGPDGRPISVGVGVHAGETVQTDEGYVGSAVNIAARVCAAAGPGELLVTDAVRALTRTYLGYRFEARGRRRLKGISEPIAIYRVTAPSAGIAGSHGRASRFDPRRHVRLVVGALAFAAVAVGASIVGAALLREGLGGVEPSSLPSQQSTQSAAGAPSDPVTLGEFPTPDEQALLDRLPDGVPARTCERATRALHSESVDPEVMPTTAAVACDPGSPSSPHQVTYWAADTSVNPAGIQGHDWVAEAFFDLVGSRLIPRGDCEASQSAHDSWSVGDVNGRFLCSLTAEGDLEIIWTYDKEQIIASAIRRDNDMGVLLAWWQDNRFISPGR